MMNSVKMRSVLMIVLITGVFIVTSLSIYTTTENRKISSLDKNSTGVVSSENASMLFSSQYAGVMVRPPSVMKKKNKKKKKKSPPPPPSSANYHHHNHSNGVSQKIYGDHAILCIVLPFFSFLFNCRNGGICL
ncbi:hypothetical protein SUGI_0303310 [Cryptomeria japonica]|nr:hypothetical protein SUGI_0303310 [Cryptomeria japonica]